MNKPLPGVPKRTKEDEGNIYKLEILDILDTYESLGGKNKWIKLGDDFIEYANIYNAVVSAIEKGTWSEVIKSGLVICGERYKYTWVVKSLYELGMSQYILTGAGRDMLKNIKEYERQAYFAEKKHNMNAANYYRKLAVNTSKALERTYYELVSRLED